MSTAACEEEAAAAGSSQTSPKAPRGIVDSGASPTPCEGQDWGGDTRRLCRCLGGRQKSRGGRGGWGGEAGGKRELADVGMSSPKTQITEHKKMCHCSIRQERDPSKGLFCIETIP